MSISPVTINEAQVREHLTMPVAIELMQTAFGQLHVGSAVNHPRQRVILPTGSILHYMAAGNEQYFGIKCYSSNPKSGAHFTFLLYRSGDGVPLANFEANQLGQIRTGAASGLATRLLSRTNARTVGIIGSGFQAQTQVEAIAAVRDIQEFRIWSRDPARRQSFLARFPHLPIRSADSAEDAVRDADIVVTATSSKEPVLDAAWIAPGTHINAMGSNWAKRRELPAEILQRAGLVVVDDADTARIESGDLLLAGFPESKWTELKQIVAGTVARASDDQITIFKSNGLAIEDVVAAGHVYEQLIPA